MLESNCHIASAKDDIRERKNRFQRTFPCPFSSSSSVSALSVSALSVSALSVGSLADGPGRSGKPSVSRVEEVLVAVS